MAVDTGHGASAAFSSSTGYDTFLFTDIDPGGESIEMIETQHLGTTTYKTYIPGDLKDTNELTFTLRFDPEDDDFIAIDVGVVQDLTVTWPLSNTGTAATLVGSGFITAFNFPPLGSETIQDATLTFKFDGTGTDPTFSEEAP